MRFFHEELVVLLLFVRGLGTWQACFASLDGHHEGMMNTDLYHGRSFGVETEEDSAVFVHLSVATGAQEYSSASHSF